MTRSEWGTAGAAHRVLRIVVHLIDFAKSLVSETYAQNGTWAPLVVNVLAVKAIELLSHPMVKLHTGKSGNSASTG